MNRRRQLVAAGIVAAAALVTPIAISLHRIRALDWSFDRIARGDDEGLAQALMGKPERIAQSSTAAFWDDEPLNDGVAKLVAREYFYSAWTPTIGIQWTVGVDASGHVISKHRWD